MNRALIQKELLAIIVVLAILLCSTYMKPQSGEPVVVSVISDNGTDESPILPGVPEPVLISTPMVAHIDAPVSVHGLYVSGWMAGTTSGMNHIYSIIDQGLINTVVIDIKDATGKLSYMPLDESLITSGVGTKRIRDLASLITTLHTKGIYVIGRLAVFQDPYLVKSHPQYAFLDTRSGDPWRDNKGIAWLRANETGVWEYVARIARDAYVQGFDEINLDYVRFPSDGPLSALDLSTFQKNKTDTMTDFFAYMDSELRGASHIPLSADVFGLTTTIQGDVGIGQLFENIVPHVDYISPMVYPSHYAVGSFGYANPADHPSEIITIAMNGAIKRMNAIGESTDKLRPWLQDFDLGATYTADMVIAQRNAAIALGVNSYLYWDPRNIYTESAMK